MSGSIALSPAEQIAAARTFARLRGLQRLPLVPLAIIVMLAIVALAAPLLTSFSPTAQSLRDQLKPPAWVAGGMPSHPLGTDELGRDLLSRLIYGSRVTLSVALTAIFVAGTLGTLVGLTAGYFGGFYESAIMRVVDAGLALPAILVAIVLASAVGPSFQNVVVVIGLLYWPIYARQVRGEVLAIKERDFVQLARVAGCSPGRILAVHVLPNVVPSLLVLASLQLGTAIVLEATLSFLGVGIPPPAPSWGVIIADGQGLLHTAWWISLSPGVAIALTVFSFNYLGDWTRDRIDPTLRDV